MLDFVVIVLGIILIIFAVGTVSASAFNLGVKAGRQIGDKERNAR